jgi:hypothetical protein
VDLADFRSCELSNLPERVQGVHVSPIGGQTGGREGSGARLGLKCSKICLGPPLCFLNIFQNFEDQKKTTYQPGRVGPIFGLFAGLVRGGETPPFGIVWYPLPQGQKKFKKSNGSLLCF